MSAKDLSYDELCSFVEDARCTVEILSADPGELLVMVPVHEHQVALPTELGDEPLSVWQALFVYAWGNPEPLLNVLRLDPNARALILTFGQHWIVWAEAAQWTSSESSARGLGDVLDLLRLVAAKDVCNDTVAEILAGTRE